MEALSAATVRLGVLPMRSHEASADESGYFSRGFLEDLTDDLSRFASLSVIDSHSAFSKQLEGLDDEEVADRLGADYLLKTSIRKYRDGVRFRAQLIDPSSGEILWADRFDVLLENLQSILDVTGEQVAAALSKQIDLARLKEARRKPFSNLAAYDCWLRGYDRLRDGSLEADAEARTFFLRALEIDPHYARAYVGLSLSHFNDWSCQASDLAEASECFSYQYAREAIRLDDQDHVAHHVLGRVLLFRRDFDRSETHIDRSLALNRNDADTLVQIGFCKALLGDPAAAIELYERAVSLNPLHESWYCAYGAFNHLLAGNYEAHLELAQRCDLRNVWADLSANVAIAHAYLGNEAEAQKHIEIFREVARDKFGLEAGDDDEKAIELLTVVNPFRKPDEEARFVRGLRMAGLGTAGQTKREPIPENRDPGPGGANVFRSEAGQRIICYEGVTVTLPEVKGFADLERLLENPGEEVHASELMGVVRSDDGTEVLDEKARRDYRERICELQADLDEAEEANDSGRTEQIREELDPLLEHLARASGLRGKSRKLNDPAERSRSAVTWRIRSGIKKIEAAHPTLAKHLGNSVRTGVFCSYVPEKAASWLT